MVYFDSSSAITISVICHHTWPAKIIGTEINKWNWNSHLCHCLCWTLDRLKSPCKIKYRNNLQKPTLSALSSPCCRSVICSFPPSFAALTLQKNAWRCNKYQLLGESMKGILTEHRLWNSCSWCSATWELRRRNQIPTQAPMKICGGDKNHNNVLI